MDRRAEVARCLSQGIAPFVLVENCEEGWLLDHPGGFGPMPQIAAGNVLEVCSERIVHHGRSLLDSQFRDFCQAIHAWQERSALNVAMQLSMDLVVTMFEQDAPVEAELLGLMAVFAELPLGEFLGAARGNTVDLG